MAVAMTTLEPAGVGMDGVSTRSGEAVARHRFRLRAAAHVERSPRSPRAKPSSLDLSPWPRVHAPPPPAPLDGGVRNLGSGAIYSLSL